MGNFLFFISQQLHGACKYQLETKIEERKSENLKKRTYNKLGKGYKIIIATLQKDLTPTYLGSQGEKCWRVREDQVGQVKLLLTPPPSLPSTTYKNKIKARKV